MEKAKYIIPVDDLYDQFNEHLDLPNNNRILFSSKYGNGKTTFLRRYFEKTTNYKAIHLFPVNYSVAKNEDIFELIKYDIFLALLTLGLPKEETVESVLSCLKRFALDNKTDLIKTFTPALSAIPLIGDVLSSTADSFIDLISKSSDHVKNQRKGTQAHITSFAQDFEEAKGNIYEHNFYTELICTLINKLRDREGFIGEVILVIDDIDRIDPEHVFRILNIFSSHNDIQDHKAKNKFGFDKIIVVADIDNLRSIFHHKYGINTDFNGYIDKFYSIDTYKYSMMDHLHKEVDIILDTIQKNKIANEFFFSPNETLLFGELRYLLKSFVNKNIINVRNIVKFYNSKIKLEVYYLGDKYRGPNNLNFWILPIFNVLKSFFGDYPEVEMALEKYSSLKDDNDFNYGDNEWRIENLFIPVLSFELGGFDNKSPIVLPMKDGRSHEVNCEIKQTPGRYNDHYFTKFPEQLPSFHHLIDINKTYYLTFKSALDKGFLK